MIRNQKDSVTSMSYVKFGIDLERKGRDPHGDFVVKHDQQNVFIGIMLMLVP